jgi:hypothetical protein
LVLALVLAWARVLVLVLVLVQVLAQQPVPGQAPQQPTRAVQHRHRRSR